MSNQVFPALPGLTLTQTKTPQWLTKIQTAVSGKETRAAFRSAAIYKFSLSYDILREAAAYTELQTLLGFFNARQGAFDSFLYTDPSDSSVVANSFGTGDGTTKSFQLVRTISGSIEPVMNLNGTAQIYDNGSLKTVTTDYTIDSQGMVTFVVAPVAGHALTWTGSYYYRCRFIEDSIDFSKFMYQLWEVKKLEMLGCLGNKI